MNVDNQYKNQLWLAGDDPVKLNELEKISVIDYYLLLDKKIADYNAQSRAAALKS